MYKIHKSAKAAEDLAGIWVYSLREWGIEQADRYLDEREAGLAQLKTNPKLGKPRDELQPGCFSPRVHQYIAYYVVTSSAVRILRVLHARMDPSRHI
ncbi:MAG: type II toxin-antitoxin system RelE/ParE family toxin [Nitrococcus sp.]|nr:type II toxin-antitoxin system RelE/ParE family toxin [Nitrococcus sp.]